MPEAERKKCFVISPIGDEKSPTRDVADKVLRHLVKKALGPDYEVERADADANPGEITPRIISSILEADLIVADLSGANPNVFYEVAIAHGFRKPTVHIQKADEALPFDIKDVRTVRYNINDPDELEKNQKTLREYAGFATKNPEKLSTPLSSAQRFASVQQSSNPIAESNVQVLEALTALRDEVRRAVRAAGGRSGTGRRDVLERLRMEEANNDSLREILARALKAGRIEPSDFTHTITSDTTLSFDEYLRDQLGSIIEGDTEAVNDILLHPDVEDIDLDEIIADIMADDDDPT